MREFMSIHRDPFFVFHFFFGVVFLGNYASVGAQCCSSMSLFGVDLALSAHKAMGTTLLQSH